MHSRTRRSACGCRCPASRGSPSGGIALNARGLVSFHERDHGPATEARWTRGSARCSRARASRADGEVVLYAFPRMLGYVFNPVSFWVCHDAGRRRARRARRGEQHVRRVAPVPARARRRTAARDRADADRAQGIPRVAVLRRARALHVPLPLRPRPLARADRLLRRRTTTSARCSKRTCPGSPNPCRRAARCRCSGATAGSRWASSRASTGRRRSSGSSACRSSRSPLRRTNP